MADQVTAIAVVHIDPTAASECPSQPPLLGCCDDRLNPQSLRGFNSHASDHLIEATCEGQTGFGIIEYRIRRGYDAYLDAHFRR